MKIITWNVNGVRAGVRKGLIDKIGDFDTDVLCIQETKAQDDQTIEALKDLEGYSIYTNSAERKGYSGTATICRKAPDEVRMDIGLSEHDNEGRVLCTDFGDFYLINVYVPNSGSGLKRLEYRAEWDKAFTNYLAGLQETKPIIVTGDLNVAHTSIDLKNDKSNYNKTAGYTQVEIDGLNNMLGIGLVDVWRKLHPDKVQYTFWNQRMRARETNSGWRIDYFLVSEPLVKNVVDATIHDDIYGSDHCPVSLVLDL